MKVENGEIWSETQECWGSQWKLEEARNRFFPTALKKEVSSARFQTSQHQQNKFLMFQAIKFMVICYGSLGKLMHRVISLISTYSLSYSTRSILLPTFSTFAFLSHRSQIKFAPTLQFSSHLSALLATFVYSSTVKNLYLEVPGLSPHYLYFSLSGLMQFYSSKYYIYTLKTHKCLLSSQTSLHLAPNLCICLFNISTCSSESLFQTRTLNIPPEHT